MVLLFNKKAIMKKKGQESVKCLMQWFWSVGFVKENALSDEECAARNVLQESEFQILLTPC